MPAGPLSAAGTTPYEEHRDYVLAVLARRCGWLDPTDREALFHDAYAVFLEKQRDGQLDVTSMRGPQIRAYLTQTALNKAMDEGKRAGRRRSVSLDDEGLGIEPPDPGKALDERLASRFDDARVREVVDTLPERQQLVIKLRYFFNRTPQEIQDYMGVTERVYRRELERATRQLAERLELVRDGTFCDSQRSLLLAYVSGVAGPTRRLQARRHLESCPGCAAWVMDMRATARRAAAFVPLPLLTLPLHRWSAGRVAAIAHLVRGRAAELAAAARDHATHAAVRADASRVAAFGTVRPGTVAAVITGCLAAGSTATYCVVNGLPAPLVAMIGAGPSHHAARHHSAREVKRRSAGTIKAVSLAPAASESAIRPGVSSQSRPTAAVPSRSGARIAARSSAGSHSQAARVASATAPEFGVGAGQAVSTSSVTRSAAPAPSASVAKDEASSSGGSRGTPAPPAATKPSPEFDP